MVEWRGEKARGGREDINVEKQNLSSPIRMEDGCLSVCLSVCVYVCMYGRAVEKEIVDWWL